MKLIFLVAVIAMLMIMKSTTNIVIAGIVDPEEGKITLDGTTSNLGRTKRQNDYEPEITDECNRLGYCTSVPNYPDELVKNLLDKGKDNNCIIFKMDELDAPLTEKSATVDLVSRMGDMDLQDNVPLCVANNQIIYPQAAPDANNIWRTVINPKENPVQSIRVEFCSNPGNQCSELITLQQGYASECQQKYEYKTVASFDQENGNIINRELKFPSSCSCVLHKLS